MAHYNNEQFAALSQYERWLRPAVFAKWCPALNERQVAELEALRSEIIKGLPKVNTSCSHCILSLLDDLGWRYFEDKEAREKAAEVEVAEAPAPATPKKRVSVKTTKK